jgi:hypothetical protein
MGAERFTLRELQSSDSPALVKLLTEFDDDLTTRFLVDPYSAIISGTENRTLGVVGECAGYDGLIGTGTVRFSRVQFNDQVFPLAFLDGLKVQKEFRGNGLGYQIARWRVQRAREEFGDQCVIGTGMLHDNHASHAVASKWCREFAESAIDVRFLPTLTRSPRPLAGVQVLKLRRRIRAYAHDKIPSTVSTIFARRGRTLSQTPCVSVEEKPYRYYAQIPMKTCRANWALAS